MIPDMRVSELFGEGEVVTQRGGLAPLGFVGYSDTAERAAAERDADVAFGQALQREKADVDVGKTKMVQTGGARKTKKQVHSRRSKRRQSQKRRKTLQKRRNWLRLTATVRLRQQK